MFSSFSVRKSSRPTQRVDYAKMLNTKESDFSGDESPPRSMKRRKLDKSENSSYTTTDSVGKSPDQSDAWRGNESTEPALNKISDYERMILKNIEERNKFLQEMGFPEAVKDLNSCLPVKVTPTLPKKPKQKSTTPKEVLPRREPSRRLRNIAAANEAKIKEIVVQEQELEENSKELTDYRFSGSLKMDDGLDVLSSLTSEATFNPDLDLTACDINQFRDQLFSLKLVRLKKVCPNRIQSLHVHPTPAKPIIFAGDAKGKFSIWDPLNTGNEITLHHINQKGINCISTSISDKSKLYTTSFDGMVVQIDFEQGQFNHMFSTNSLDRIHHLTWHDEFEREQFLIAHGLGEVGILDARTHGKQIQNWIECFERSVKTVQHHPSQTHYFVASSGTGTMKVFDLRNPIQCVAEKEHPKGVISAFFSPDGNSILSNCNDDFIRIFDSSVISGTMNCKIRYQHNNFTGRWLSPFKAVWAPQRNDVFHIGSLLKDPRRLQFYKADSAGILLNMVDPEEMITISSIISMHPTLPMVAAANSSGKVHLFGPPEMFTT